MSGFVEWRALVDVVVLGLVVGAGMPALFALGVRALAGAGSRDDAGHRPRIRVAAAIACLTVVAGAIVAALVIIGSGKH